MRAYYNEFDPYAAQWLRNLIEADLIPRGHVDERSIINVPAKDLMGYNQCHFFAGIGGWPHALRLAKWPDDRAVWTASLPCQPFSAAGRHGGRADERHLWPAFYTLLAEYRPPVAFGEQVASAAGREWLSGVRADLEAVGYAVGAADLPAAGVGAPHVRQRLYWVANAEGGWRRIDGQKIQGASGGRCGPSFWSEFDEIPDGGAKPLRRIEPRASSLAPRVPCYLDKLRAYGNAIVPQLGAEFIAAYMEL